MKYHGKKIKDSCSRALPIHVHTPLQVVTRETWPLHQTSTLASPIIGVQIGEMHSLVPTLTPSRPNSLASQFAIPSIMTIP